MATRQPDGNRILQRLSKSIASLDQQRTVNLHYIQLLQENKNRALKKEQVRLRKKYGENHPLVAKINTRLNYNKIVLPQIKKEVERSAIETPEFDRNTWTVYGQVINKEFVGVKGLTLALYNTDGKVEKRLGWQCREGEKPPFDPKADFFLVVSDTKSHICHREKEPLHIVPGRNDYRRIIVDTVSCTPPPDSYGNGDDDDNGE